MQLTKKKANVRLLSISSKIGQLKSKELNDWIKELKSTTSHNWIH